MLTIDIPGFGDFCLNYALIDFNGTLAVDGKLIQGISEPLNCLSKHLELHIITGDGHGTAKAELEHINCTLTITPAENQAITKREYLHQLNPKETVAIGNGRNDAFILKESILGIAIMGEEGCAADALLSADLIMPSITLALNALQNPQRLRASLRY
ncbi:HAD family hydrolase [Legionella quateirensis]|uniref:Soluble P-type ATPase n=1 Tax=Legionella quateirensis TaxID=45072 RepID=A0A378KSP5_9GAMM|nr:HAD family hydrolase [Legionella quateirensis]KTD50870.1 hypothetical protein Lqua_1097 [Legionella quateirensis]STY17884.1 Soluble P-type ATPase [Legionella quateirensis]